MQSSSTYKLVLTGLLIAVGVAIPMFMPLKVVIEPASYTLASHVAVFIAMFISPGTAVAVALGTTVGFFFGGFPIVIVFRAASHLVFSIVGALMFRSFPVSTLSPARLRLFSFLIALIHSVCELAVVTFFYFGGGMLELYYQQGFVWSVLLLVGLGTVIHSMVDFEIANAITIPLRSRLESLSEKPQPRKTG